MPINTLTLAEKMTGELDKLYVQTAQTGFLADNATRAKFVGAGTVLIPEMALSGLGDYDRDNGSALGSVTVTRVPYTLTMERGRKFQIDSEDMDELGVANLAGETTGEFVRTKVVPECDAYVLSKLAAMATTKLHTVSVGAASTLEADCFKMFQDAVIGVQNQVGFNEPLVAFINPTFQAALNASTAFTRQLTVSDFSKGGVNLKVKTIDDVPLIPVNDACMKSAYTFLDGTTAGQTVGGFTPAGSAKSIGLLVMTRKGASLVKKTEKLRIFAAAQNQDMDAWKFDYRLYYDLIIPTSKQNGIYAYTY